MSRNTTWPRKLYNGKTDRSSFLLLFSFSQWNGKRCPVGTLLMHHKTKMDCADTKHCAKTKQELLPGHHTAPYSVLGLVCVGRRHYRLFLQNEEPPTKRKESSDICRTLRRRRNGGRADGNHCFACELCFQRWRQHASQQFSDGLDCLQMHSFVVMKHMIIQEQTQTLMATMNSITVVQSRLKQIYRCTEFGMREYETSYHKVRYKQHCF